MPNKKIRDTLNDGYVAYGRRETQRSEKGKRIGEVFVAKGKLAYRELSCRESDYQMAQVMSATLDMKIQTLCPPFFKHEQKSKLVMVKDGIEFDVIKVDTDREKMYLYFYLQEVGVHEQNKSTNAKTSG